MKHAAEKIKLEQSSSMMLSSYDYIYSVMVMGSYSRNLLIGSVVGLIGIVICLAIEWRRNLGQAPSDRQLPETESDQLGSRSCDTLTKPTSSFLSVGHKQAESFKDLLNMDANNLAEDDVTCLFGPVSIMSLKDNSSPALPLKSIHYNESIMNFKKVEDIERFMKEEGSALKIEPSNTSTHHSAIMDRVIKKTQSTELEPETFHVNTLSDDRQHLIDTESPVFCEDPIAVYPQIVEDFQTPKLDTTPIIPLSSNPLEETDPGIFHGMERLSKEPIEEENLTPNFHSDLNECSMNNGTAEYSKTPGNLKEEITVPICPVDGTDQSIFLEKIRSTKESIEDTSIPTSYSSDSNECSMNNGTAEYSKIPGILKEEITVPICHVDRTDQSIFQNSNIRFTKESIENESIPTSYSSVPNEGCMLTERAGYLKFPESLKEEITVPICPVDGTEQSIFLDKTQCTQESNEDKSTPTSFSSDLNESIMPNVLLVVHRNNLKDLNVLVDNSNSVIFGNGDVLHFSPSEETRLAQCIKDSLGEACASDLPVPQTTNNGVQDPTLEPMSKEITKHDIKSSNIKPLSSRGLRYADVAAVPKKATTKYKGSFGKPKDETRRNYVDSDQDETPKTPTKYGKQRVRKLVGFFEGKVEKL